MVMFVGYSLLVLSYPMARIIMEVLKVYSQFRNHNNCLGFVIDVSILELLHVDVYAIVRIDKLMTLKHSEGKLVITPF